MNCIRFLMFFKTAVILLLAFNGTSQHVYQDSLLKVIGVDEVIYTKDVYYDKDYRFTAPVIFGFDSLNAEGMAFTSVRYIGKNSTIFQNLFNEESQIIEKTWSRNSLGSITRAREYEYDDRGRLKFEFVYNENEIHVITT